MAWTCNRNGSFLSLIGLLSAVIAITACSASIAPQQPQAHPTAATLSSTTASRGTASPAGSTTGTGSTGSTTGTTGTNSNAKSALHEPTTLLPLPGTRTYPGEGVWQPAGRPVAGKSAVYETMLVPPGGTARAGIAWMDTHLLSARLYSGSMSPGGGPYRYTAPVARTAARSLVAAFNGGFQMKDAHGGYYTEGRMIRPLVRGGASLVIYANGSVTIGAWGSDVTMTPSVVSVRQNLYPLVVNGRPSTLASTRDWLLWGGTCPCGKGQHGYENQWRSGLGVTADGALVYVVGPKLAPFQVAALLVRAGAVSGMQLDINPTWPVFASFKPATPDGLAAPSNGARLIATYRGPATFFDPTYARDFITMSARPVEGSR